MERYQEIERSIIKRYRKPIWRKFIEGIKEYELIEEGDKIAVCISGGKDSMLLAKCMQEIQRHGQIHFDLEFIVMDPGYNPLNRERIIENAKIMNIPIDIFNTEIFDTVVNIQDNPCYLCARMRRGYLYKKAQALGCNKIALGHHFDDVIETILMSILYGGQFTTMMPKLKSTNHPGMVLIRPLYYVKEKDIIHWMDYNDLHFIQCACRFTENISKACNAADVSKRQEMKQLINQFRETSDIIEMNIFKSMYNVNLNTVISYQENGKKHHFLERFHETKSTKENLKGSRNMKYKFEQSLMPECKKIREEVFIKEQKFKNEFDDIDETAYHLVLFQNDEPAATGRMYLSEEDNTAYILGRIAVLKDYRKQHLGKEVLAILEERAKNFGAVKTVLSAQMQAKGFYEKYGYKQSGEIYYDEHCPHVHMEKILIEKGV